MRLRETIKKSSGTGAGAEELVSSVGTRDCWKERLRGAVRKTRGIRAGHRPQEEDREIHDQTSVSSKSGSHRPIPTD